MELTCQNTNDVPTVSLTASCAHVSRFNYSPHTGLNIKLPHPPPL
jgi:hypothetical protein